MTSPENSDRNAHDSPSENRLTFASCPVLSCIGCALSIRIEKGDSLGVKKLNFHIAKVSRLLLKKHPNHTHLRGRGSAVQPGSIVSFLPSFRHGQSFLIVASSGETQWSAVVNDVLPRENIKIVLQLRNTRRKRLRLLNVNRLGVRTAQATKTRISDHRGSGYRDPYAQSVS